MILLFRNPVLDIELSPMNKKFNCKKFAKFVIARVFFYPIDSKFLP